MRRSLRHAEWAVLLAVGCATAPAPTPAPVGEPAASLDVATVPEEFQVAEAARRAGRWEESLRLYEEVSLADRESFEAAWRCARAVIELLDWTWEERRRDERIVLAQRAINHAERAVAMDDTRPDGHYYRAVAYGMLGKAKGLGGKKTVEPIIESAERVIAIDPSYAGAGAHRLLGALYAKAPAWPTGVGDLERSREELEIAVKLSPDTADNHLFLARTCAELGDRERAEAELARFREIAAPLPIWRRARLWTEEAREVERLLG